MLYSEEMRCVDIDTAAGIYLLAGLVPKNIVWYSMTPSRRNKVL
jgi:hypothetical protein